MIIHPKHIITRKFFGKSSMGDVTDPGAGVRILIPEAPVGFALYSLQVRCFTGSDGNARLSLKRDDPDDVAFDFEDLYWDNFGLGAVVEVFARTEMNELGAMSCYRTPLGLGSYVLEWSNPQSVSWGVMARLVDHENIPDYISQTVE